MVKPPWTWSSKLAHRVSYLLSIEFVAPEADFVDAWETLDDVLLIGTPILAEFDGEEIAEDIGGGGRQ